MREYSSGDLLKGSICAIASLGKGILRMPDGFIVFVPFTAPEDEVTVRLTSVKKGFAFGELIAIHKASPFRTEPKCPYFGVCGGCQLQHILYEEQLACKKDSIKDSFSKFANTPDFSLTISPSDKRWNYRRHIHLTIRCERDVFTAGYISMDNRTLVMVDSCPIFIPDGETIIREVQLILSKLAGSPGNTGKVMIIKDEENGYLLHFHFKKLPKNYTILFEAYERHPDWKGVLISAPNYNKSIGKETLTAHFSDIAVHYTSRSFMQNNPEESAKIYQEIEGIVRRENTPFVLDLYSGIGISSLLAARYAKKVLGIESNPAAVAAAKENALSNQIYHASFRSAKVEDIIKNVLKEEEWSLILANPPRDGLLKKVKEALLAFRPKHFIYVSCMPATLARDLKMFFEEGYTLKRCQAFDMFPQTGHVETLAYLTN